MTALALSYKICRAFLFASLAGLLYNLVEIYRLDAIAPYGFQSVLFLNGFILFLSLIYLEKSHRAIHLTGGIASLIGVVLSALCFFDINKLPVLWNYIFLVTSIVITLTLFERLRKKTGSLALLALVMCVITMIAFSFILLTKHNGEAILTLFNYLSIISIVTIAIAIIFYARKDQSTKVP